MQKKQTEQNTSVANLQISNKVSNKKTTRKRKYTQAIIHLVHWKNFPKNVRVRIRG